MRQSKGKLKNFRDRLRYLVGDEKPYSWCKKANIEKGLFQYYWQKGNIPKSDNLLKIRACTGCSIDWLLTGDGEAFPYRAEDISSTLSTVFSQIDTEIVRLEKFVNRLKNIRKEV